MLFIAPFAILKHLKTFIIFLAVYRLMIVMYLSFPGETHTTDVTCAIFSSVSDICVMGTGVENEVNATPHQTGVWGSWSNFVGISGKGDGYYDNLRCHQWRQIWYHGSGLFFNIPNTFGIMFHCGTCSLLPNRVIKQENINPICCVIK